jgi:hypothetical protein
VLAAEGQLADVLQVALGAEVDAVGVGAAGRLLRDGAAGGAGDDAEAKRKSEMTVARLLFMGTDVG